MTIPKQDGESETVKTCPAAMGFAFAAGTTDGPGAFDFTQGDDKVINICSIHGFRMVLCCMPVFMFKVYCDAMSGQSILEAGTQLT